MRYLLQGIQGTLVGPEFILRLPWLLKLFSVLRLCKESAQEPSNTGRVEGSCPLKTGTSSYHFFPEDLPDVQEGGLLGTRLSGHAACIQFILYLNKHPGVSL